MPAFTHRPPPLATDVYLDGLHGPVLLRGYAPVPGTAVAELVWVHGGGFFAGDVAMPEADAVARALAASGVQVWTVNYRRSRPHWRNDRWNRYPVPLDDVASAIQYRQQSTRAPLFVGGASAGACLIASALSRPAVRDAPLPAGAVFAYGLFHAALPKDPHAPASRSHGHRRITHSSAALRLMAWNYAGSRWPRTAPHAFPGSRPTAALPPSLFLDAEQDTLTTSSNAYARQLETVGTSVTRAVISRSEHGFLNRPDQPPFQTGIDMIQTWIRTLLTDPSSTRPPRQ